MVQPHEITAAAGAAGCPWPAGAPVLAGDPAGADHPAPDADRDPGIPASARASSRCFRPIIGPVTDPGTRGAKQVDVDFYGHRYKLMTSAILYKQASLTDLRQDLLHRAERPPRAA